ncbi:MAG: response regulator [Myxococcaceae bacterium]|nr:response regulator [Myxococcaceae bacterium]
MLRSTPSLPGEVLIVEDDPALLKAYGRLADRYGFTLRTATRTTEVLRLALMHRPDAIVLDYEVEDGNSLKLLRTLKYSPETAQIPIAIVSGYLSDHTLARIHEVGGVTTLEKPWTVDEILGLLLRLGAEAAEARKAVDGRRKTDVTSAAAGSWAPTPTVPTASGAGSVRGRSGRSRG